MFEQSDIKIWMANHDIAGGENFASAIVPAIEDCSCFVLLLTQEAQESVWVDKEVERAVHYNKPIVPIRLNTVELNKKFEFYISTSQIVKLPCIDINDTENKQLVATVKNHINGKFRISLPRKGTGPKAWLPLAITAAAILLALILALSIIIPKFNSDDIGTGLNPFTNTVAPPDADVVDQIPEKYAEEILTIKDSESNLNNIMLDVGDYIVPQAAQSWDCYIYSQNSHIVVGEGRRIQGLSAGTTYIVVVAKQTGMAEAYRVTVNDPSAGLKGVNQVPEELAFHIEDFKNTSEGHQKVSNVSVKVGKDVAVAPLFSDGCTIWSADTGITVATGTGSMVRGVSPGTTYVLLRTSTGLYSTYRVVVSE